MRSPRRFSLLDATLLTGVFLCLLFVSAAGPALAATSRPFTFENADIQTVVKQVANYPTNSLIISGHPAAVEQLVDIIK